MLPSNVLTASASQQAEFSELNLHGLLPCCGRVEEARGAVDFPWLYPPFSASCPFMFIVATPSPPPSQTTQSGFPAPDTSTRATSSLQWVPWPLLAEALRFPTFSGTMGVYDCSSVHSQTSMVDPRCPPYRSRERRRRALLGSWAIPLETCPGLATPATPARPRINGRCQIL